MTKLCPQLRLLQRMYYAFLGFNINSCIEELGGSECDSQTRK
jgi:hypothetical protein